MHFTLFLIFIASITLPGSYGDPQVAGHPDDLLPTVPPLPPIPPGSPRIAIIGEGIVGTSTAAAIKELSPEASVTIYHDKDLNETVSWKVPGLFRIKEGTPINRYYANETFNHLASLWRDHGGFSGVQMVSGHVLSANKTSFQVQRRSFEDIVYHFRPLQPREIRSQFKIDDDDVYAAIHYTAFTSEGSKYIPWMKERLMRSGVAYRKKRVKRVEEMGDEFDVVVNCGGMNGGVLSDDGDAKNMYPIRGVLVKVASNWTKHFLFKDFETYVIPGIDHVYVGTLKESHEDNVKLTEAELEEKKTIVWNNVLGIFKPLEKVAPREVLVDVRPARVGGVRVERAVKQTTSGKSYVVVHNYGHAGNGFTLGWGSAVHAAKLGLGMDVSDYEKAREEPIKPMNEEKKTVVEQPTSIDQPFLHVSLAILVPLLCRVL